jgi:hypothetical protein
MKLAACDLCKVIDWVNGCRIGIEDLQICAVCFDRSDILVDDPPVRPDRSARNDSNPFQENAIRALEGD